MCGIAGFAGSRSRAILEGMTAAVASRGPDAVGFWSDETAGVQLGHRRLSILDLAGGGQPMATPDGDLVIVFNGEIYNFAELRHVLAGRGHKFVTDHSDTEVLLHGYREWGRGLPEHLNGMWAFVIYDRLNQRLFGSRDRFGEKPLFYYDSGSEFVFGSELECLRRHPATPSRLSRLALQKYFAYGYIPAPLSLIERVHKLPGGSSFTYDLAARRCDLHRYWEFRLEPFESTPANPEETWGEQLRHLLDAAVHRQLVADVPIGVFLSGGIDSSIITALASRHVPAGRLKTFSVGFEEGSFDESASAKRVAALFGTAHHAEILSLARAHELLPELTARLDEPMGDSSLLPMYLLSRFTRRHVTVALGGDGGDELFAGYDPFHALRRAELYQRFIPRPVHQAIRLLVARAPVSHRNMSFDFKVKRALRGLEHPPRLWLPVWMAPLDTGEIAELFSSPIDPEELFSEAIAAWESPGPAGLVDRTLQYFTRLYLQDDILAKVDRATMMVGLEARSPFLDIEVVDFARRLPSAWKFRHGQTKYLLKRAFEPLLPHDVLYRKKKGFGLPVGQWFRDGRLEVDPAGPLFGLDSGFIRREAAAHRDGRRDQRAFLWSLALLQGWARQRMGEFTHE